MCVIRDDICVDQDNFNKKGKGLYKLVEKTIFQIGGYLFQIKSLTYLLGRDCSTEFA